MAPPPDRPVPGPERLLDPDPWHQLGLVVEDLVRARSDLVTATREVEEAGAELARRTAEIGDLDDVVEAVLAGTDEVVLVVDAGTRRVRAWSAGAARRFGLGADEVVGRALVAVRAEGLPSGGLADEVARLARPAPDEAAPAVAVVAGPDDRFALHPVPGRPARSVVIRPVAAPAGSDVHAGPQPADDAGQPA